MSVQEEQERRRELLLRALEACPGPEKALAIEDEALELSRALWSRSWF